MVRKLPKAAAQSAKSAELPTDRPTAEAGAPAAVPAVVGSEPVEVREEREEPKREKKGEEVVVGHEEKDLVVLGQRADEAQRLEEEAQLPFLSRCCTRLCHQCRDCWRGFQLRCSRGLDALEALLTAQQAGRRRSRFQAELRNLASEKLPKLSTMERLMGPSAKTRELCQSLTFKDEEVLHAFAQAEQKSSPFEALEQDFWSVLPRLLCQVFLVVILCSGVFCLLATIALAPTRSITLSSTGRILDAGSVAGSASVVHVRPVWDFPLLSFNELRQIEEVVFEHQHEVHVLKVAVTTKLPDGSVLLQSTDSALRVQADGQAFWQTSSEVFLADMEALRTISGGDRLLGSLLSVEVLQS
ncbi:unnamed protein product [Durusdinium trenchii]|uniref:Uncharacterized protein n=2 Tax=Durusdinium trenchii TaxID=1381693 RepID=A0ABP0S8Y8_9DINO